MIFMKNVLYEIWKDKFHMEANYGVEKKKIKRRDVLRKVKK